MNWPEQGYSREYGVRPLRRVIQEQLQDNLSDALLRDEFSEGDAIQVDFRPIVSEDRCPGKSVHSRTCRVGRRRNRGK